MCSVIFSFLYQFSSVEDVNLQYFKQRSQCDYCHTLLKWFDTIPLLSFIYLKGHSRCCSNTLKRSYFIGEVLSFLIVPYVLFTHIHINYSLFILTCLMLITMSITDIETLTINSNLIFVFFFTGIYISSVHYISFIIIFFLLHTFFLLNPKSIGYGDILLLSLLSLFYTYEFMLHLLLLTCVISIVFFIIMYRFMIHKIPLIPFISISYIVLINFSDNIM
ncbi:leader peptidase (prepilin peptidase) / N-methyltransferase [Staphylococcus hominis]